jgi:hypothetical protein
MTIAAAQRWNLTFAAGVVAASLVLATPAFALAVAVGVALEAVNFRALCRWAELLFSGGVTGARGWSIGFGARFLLLGFGLAAAIYLGAHPVGLLIGFSLIIPAVLVEAWRTRPPVLENAPALSPDDPSWERWDPWLAREHPEEDEEGP